MEVAITSFVLTSRPQELTILWNYKTVGGEKMLDFFFLPFASPFFSLHVKIVSHGSNPGKFPTVLNLIQYLYPCGKRAWLKTTIEILIADIPYDSKCV